MDTKTRPLCVQETHIKTRDTYRLKVKGWKKIFHANRDQKKTGVAILISDKIDFFFLFIFKLYITVLVLPNIKMNPPQVYMCSPS